MTSARASPVFARASSSPGILLAASLPTLAGVAPESREALALVFQSMLVLLPLALWPCSC